MPGRPVQRFLPRLLPCFLLCGLVEWPTPAMALPAKAPISGIAPLARQQVRITASVRPTMTVRQNAIGNNRRWPDVRQSFCIWSNSPTRSYDVRIELDDGQVASQSQRPAPLQIRWNGESVAPIVAGRASWIRDQLAEGDSASCERVSSILETMNVERSSGLLMLMISPQ